MSTIFVRMIGKYKTSQSQRIASTYNEQGVLRPH